MQYPTVGRFDTVPTVLYRPARKRHTAVVFALLFQVGSFQITPRYLPYLTKNGMFITERISLGLRVATYLPNSCVPFEMPD